MKKQIFFLTILILLTTLVFTEGINVTSPGAGNNLYKNSNVNITWTSTVCDNRAFKINIFKNQVSQANFVEQLIATNVITKTWRIPGNYATGNYVIRVKTEDNNCSGDSGVFHIGDPPTANRTIVIAGTNRDTGKLSEMRLRQQQKLNKTNMFNSNELKPAYINITFPSTGHTWNLNNGNTSSPYPVRIEWTKGGVGVQNNTVKILMKRKLGGSGVNNIFNTNNLVVASGTPNNGLFNGTISRNYEQGLYSLWIETDGGKIKSESIGIWIANQ